MRSTPTFLGPRPGRRSSNPSTTGAPAPATLPHLAAVDLLPFSIAHDGPAKVSAYFHPTPRASTSTSPAGAPASNASDPSAQSDLNSPALTLVPLQAAFRGRLMCSTPLALPTGYTGLIFSTTAPAPTPPSPAASGTKRPAPGTASSRPAKRLSLAAGSRLPGGSRRSPRKAVRAAYKLDSDEEDEDEAGEGVKGEEDDDKRVGVHIQIEEKVVEEAPVAVAPISLSANPSLLIEPPSSPPPKATITADAKAEEEVIDESSVLERDVKYLVPVATFGGLQVWNADYAPTNLDEDLFAKGVGEWVRVAAMVSCLKRSRAHAGLGKRSADSVGVVVVQVHAY